MKLSEGGAIDGTPHRSGDYADHSPVTTGRGRSGRLVAVAGVMALVAGATCGSPEHLTTFDRSANGLTVAVAVGDEFEIALDSVGPGSFGPPTVSSSAVRFLSESESSCSGPCSPGGGKTQHFRFEAVSPGRAEITIQFVPTGWVFGMTVQVY